MVERKQVYISKNIKQRGTGREIDRANAIVYDFMPIIIGDEFRTNKILSRQLFREPPVDGIGEAYDLLGTRYLKKRQITEALECYKFSLEGQIHFIDVISAVQESALLTQEEVSRLDLDSSIEKSLIQYLVKNRKEKVNLGLYSAWLDRLRAGYLLEKQYNQDNNECFKKPNLELQLELGMWGNDCNLGVEYAARKLGDQNLIKRVRLTKPKEILDLKFLRKYDDDNAPTSTGGVPGGAYI